MLSSRATSRRRRRRGTTSRVLELLNNVNHVNPEHQSSPPYRPRSSRQTDNRQIVRSNTIWDIPNSDSPERTRFSPSNRVPLSEPITPRRSARIQSKLDSKVTPTREPQRTSRAASVELGEEEEEEEEEKDEDGQSERASENDPDEDSAEYSDEEENKTGRLPNNMDIQEEHWDVPRVVLYSGGRHSPRSPENPTLPSPSVFHEQRSAPQLEKSLKPSEVEGDSSDESQDEYRTPRTGTPEQVHSSFDAQEQSRSSPAATINPVTEVSNSAISATPARRSTASIRRTPTKDMFSPSSMQAEWTDLFGDGDSNNAEPESDAEDPVNTPVEENSSAYIPSDNEDSASSPGPYFFRDSLEPAEDVATPPSKRRRTGSRPQRVLADEEPPRKRSTLLSRAASSWRPRGKPTKPLRPSRHSNDPQQHVTDISEDDSDVGEESWFDKVLKLSGQKANWDTLVGEARVMKEIARPSMSKYFGEFDDFTSRLRANYMDIVHHLDDGRGPPRARVRECDDLMDAILKEGNFLLDDAYYHANDERDPRRPSSSKLVDEFEARLVSEMVDVILPCFEAYHREEGLFPEAYDHLHRALNLLLRLCNRIYSIVSEGYVRSKGRSHIVQLPLKKLIVALKDNVFKEGASQSAPVHVISIKHGKKWSDDEGLALLEGLQLYQGPHRYDRILKRFREQLRGRTIRSVREKARQVHDNLLPLVDQTDEGREQWRWLLSVREE
ncbi:hypothetical protein BBP40_010456 [Aspergillus hancockii]|nr:hypothetical protein BBP40_010456 [Aspergillus hancockii]